MSTLTATAAPAVGSQFTSHATGRTWQVSRIGDTGTIGLTEKYYGPGCERRSYVTKEELAAEYTLVPD